MKKILLLFLMLISIGCTNEEINNFTNTIGESINNMTKTPEYVDTNPIKVGLYRNGKLVHEFNNKFKDYIDVAVFDIVYTNDENLGSTNLKKNWSKYYNQYENIDDYKIGFYLEFEMEGNKVENIILDPSAKYKAGPCIFVYLYDGIHQKDGVRYSHLEMKDIKDDTIYSSIKLYMEQAKKITSPIKLTVFTYKNDYDFDTNGYYRGNSKYTVTIYNK